MPLAAGARLGSYEIVGPLGAGGMGEVYRAHDSRLGRDVAVKVLPDDVASSPDRLTRFEREARAVARLNHPNIVILHSIEEAAGMRLLTMELIEGRSLAELVTPDGLPIGRVLDLVIPLADALAAAHAKGVVHRDLKPANVMVTDDGRVKVLDFGLARLASAAPDDAASRASTMGALSMPGEVLGTVPYMAPEQIFGEAVDARTDLFAFGIVLFELVTGRRPFAGGSYWETASSLMQDDAPSLASVRRDVPEDLVHIVGRCLQKRPDDRFQSASELASELRALGRALDRGAASPAAPATDAIASIAVLPFANRSSNADDEYFSDGLADELLGLLAKIKGLRVSARASSFQFRGGSVPLREVGRALHVATVLDGSVRRAGNRVRISVQLVKVADGYQLWSETYDRTLDDIFAVQDDIAQAVVKELRATLIGGATDSAASGRAHAEVDRAARGRGSDPEAYRLYLLARHAMDQLSRAPTAKAIGYLTQAVERDPTFALAWTELSVAYVREAGWGLVPSEVAFARAREAVMRAVTLEPGLAEAHAQVAWMQIFLDRDWRGAEDSLARAAELAPGSPGILRLRGVLADVLGRPQEAAATFRLALEQDPLSAAAYHSLGLALHAIDDHAGAEDAFRKALELAPLRMATHAHLAVGLVAQGRSGDASVEAAREPEAGFRLWAEAIVHGVLDDAARSDAALHRLVDEHADGWALQIAEVLAVRGERDAAFEWLDRALAKRDPGLARVRSSPQLRALHGDARWLEFLERMGFPESTSADGAGRPG